MKHLIIILIGFSLSLTWSSCTKDKEGTLVLHFKPVYDGQTLSTFTTKPFENGEQIQFNHMSMLISDLRLYLPSSEENLRDIELVDMSFTDIQSSAEGYTVTLNHVPANTYQGIRFGIGVPPDINQKKPSDFSSSSPLSKTGYYWVAWNSYIFSKTEGRLDTLGNGTFDLGFALHTGSDKLFRGLDGPIPITIGDGKSTNIDILVDYKKLLADVDIKAKPQNHNPSDTVEILKIVNNLALAVSLAQ